MSGSNKNDVVVVREGGRDVICINDNDADVNLDPNMEAAVGITQLASLTRADQGGVRAHVSRVMIHLRTMNGTDASREETLPNETQVSELQPLSPNGVAVSAETIPTNSLNQLDAKAIADRVLAAIMGSHTKNSASDWEHGRGAEELQVSMAGNAPVEDSSLDNSNTTPSLPSSSHALQADIEYQSREPDLITNQNSFECTICLNEIQAHAGVELRACSHMFCQNCLMSLVQHCPLLNVPCPFTEVKDVACNGILCDREVRALADREVLDRRTSMSLKLAGCDTDTGEVWPSLLQTTISTELVSNVSHFDCPLCQTSVEPGGGVVLKDCLHRFCRTCMLAVINGSDSTVIACPCPSSDYTCDGSVLEEEIRALLGPVQYVRHLVRCVCTGGQRTSTLGRLTAASRQGLVRSVESFNCGICFTEVEPAAGVTLQECLHSFCAECLAALVSHCDDASVRCPFTSDQYSCTSTLTEREIRALVTPAEYERHLQRSLRLAENTSATAFHCRTPGCAGWCEVEDAVNTFFCPVCQSLNCITCRAIHEQLTCRQYQDKLAEDARHDEEARKTQLYIRQMLNRRDAILCPICGIVIMKKSGCDCIVCSGCRQEVCWVTGKPRRGPRGCRCGEGGRKCHPDCQFCH